MIEPLACLILYHQCLDCGIRQAITTDAVYRMICGLPAKLHTWQPATCTIKHKQGPLMHLWVPPCVVCVLIVRLLVATPENKMTATLSWSDLNGTQLGVSDCLLACCHTTTQWSMSSLALAPNTSLSSSTMLSFEPVWLSKSVTHTCTRCSQGFFSITILPVYRRHK